MVVADARGPQAVAAEVRDAGAHPVELSAAIDGNQVIILSIPFSKQPELRALLTTAVEDTVIVDTSNYYPDMTGRIEDIDEGQVESLWVQQHLGRPIVKAWNAALAETQATKGRSAGSADRIAIPVAADAPQARALVMQLVDDTGFDPFDAGSLNDSWRQQPGTPAYCTELGLDALGEALGAADKDRAPKTRDNLMAHFATLPSWPRHEDTVAINRAAH